MKIRILGAIALVLILSLFAGCKSGGGSSAGGDIVLPDGVYISCMDAKNDGQASDCSTVPAAFNSATVAAVNAVDVGVVYDNQLAEITVEVTNGSDTPWSGYWEVVWDTPCAAGTEPFKSVVMSPFSTVPAAVDGVPGVVSVTDGSWCYNTPLGQRTITATIYESDQVTVRDEYAITFEYAPAP